MPKLTDKTEATTLATGDKTYIVDVSDTASSAQGTGKWLSLTTLVSWLKTQFFGTSNQIKISSTGVISSSIGRPNADPVVTTLAQFGSDNVGVDLIDTGAGTAISATYGFCVLPTIQLAGASNTYPDVGLYVHPTFTDDGAARTMNHAVGVKVNALMKGGSLTISSAVGIEITSFSIGVLNYGLYLEGYSGTYWNAYSQGSNFLDTIVTKNGIFFSTSISGTPADASASALSSIWDDGTLLQCSNPTHTGFRQIKVGALVLHTGTKLVDGGSRIYASNSAGNGYFPFQAASFLVGVTTANASSVVDISSTNQGALLPRMTTTQKAAISSPAEGLEVYDLTLHKKCIFTGSVWETITSA